ncbi:hypothetical protein ACHAWF_016175 [Thalassiosira exigua]
MGLRDKAAVHAYNKAEGLLQPLIEADNESVSSDEMSYYSGSASSVPVEAKPTAMQMLVTAVVSLGLAAGAAASVGVIVLNPATIVYAMAGVCLVNIPVSAYKEYKIVKLPAMRSYINSLEDEAKRLENEVIILAQEIDELEPEVERTHEASEELNKIAVEQHIKVDKIVELVQDNETILSQMRDNVRERIIQEVTKIVMLSDRNGDGKFTQLDTRMMVLKLSVSLQEYEVAFDEDKFYIIMREEPTVMRALKILKRLIPASLPTLFNDEGSDSSTDEDEDDDAYDMFFMDGDSRLGSSFSTRPSEAPARTSLAVDAKKSTSRRSSELRRTRHHSMHSAQSSPRERSTSRLVHSAPERRRRKRESVKSFWKTVFSSDHRREQKRSI